MLGYRFALLEIRNNSITQPTRDSCVSFEFKFHKILKARNAMLLVLLFPSKCSDNLKEMKLSQFFIEETGLKRFKSSSV